MAVIDEIRDKLDILEDIKSDIKSVIISKGQTVGDDMNDYGDAIRNISSSGYKYLTFTSQEDGSTVYLNNHGTNNPDCEYSTDGVTWITMPTTSNDAMTLDEGEFIYVRGNNPNGFSTSGSNFSVFVFTGFIAASGSVMSLIDRIGETDVIPCDYCFLSMFYNCTALTTAPDLPATTLADYCYYEMFWMCTALTTAPTLPAMTLAGRCYELMFWDCTALTTAPELPATTLADYCYYGMFEGCISLTTAPELSATILVPYCYSDMFKGCTNLNYVKCLAISGINTNNSTNSWMTNAGSAVTGEKVFIKDMNATWPTGNSGIPSGWIVKYAEVEAENKSATVSISTTITATSGKLMDEVDVEIEGEENYLTFETSENIGSLSIYLENIGSNTPNCEYSFDKITWTAFPTSSASAVIANAGQKIYVRGNNPNGFSTSDNDYSVLILRGTTCLLKASGSVMSLIDGKGATKIIPCNYCFYGLFDSCVDLSYAPELPATTLTEWCYSHMFYGCRYLTTLPELPATDLTGCDYCYHAMFYGCTDLIIAPSLPATTLADSCYQSMFYSCTSLETAPVLPTITLEPHCYQAMFYNCISLTTAPELPATTLAEYCYEAMFQNCTSLTTAPELPTTTLASYCYSYMFQNCTHLSSLRVHFTDWNTSNNSTTNWLYNVPQTGTFYCPLSLDTNTRDTSHVPSGWKVLYNLVKRIELTQEEYDDLLELDPDAIYIIIP